MKKLFIIAIPIILIIASCTKDISSYNEETKKASKIPPGPLFSNAVKTLTDGLVSTNVNVNIYRHIVKHWGQAVIQEEAQYDYITRASNQSWWTRMYVDVLNDLKESAMIITNDALLNPDIKANQLAMIDVMQVYTYSVLINTFGDIPYSEALDSEKLFPKYDDAQTVYNDLMRRLADDISKMKSTAAGFTATEDVFFQGKVSKWIRSKELIPGFLSCDAQTGYNANDPKGVFGYLHLCKT